MSFRRFLCSQLVTLRKKSAESGANPIAGSLVVNLAEIWKTGAVLEAEEPLEEGSAVEIHCENVFFAGRIVRVELHEFGWRFEVKFSPMTPWDPEQFQPRHLLDPSSLDPSGPK
jgi:hypothetical protein